MSLWRINELDWIIVFRIGRSWWIADNTHDFQSNTPGLNLGWDEGWTPLVKSNRKKARVCWFRADRVIRDIYVDITIRRLLFSGPGEHQSHLLQTGNCQVSFTQAFQNLRSLEYTANTVQYHQESTCNVVLNNKFKIKINVWISSMK